MQLKNLAIIQLALRTQPLSRSPIAHSEFLRLLPLEILVHELQSGAYMCSPSGRVRRARANATLKLQNAIRTTQGVQDLKSMDMSSELKGSKETHTHQHPNSPWVSHSIRYHSWLLTSPTPEMLQKLELAHWSIQPCCSTGPCGYHSKSGATPQPTPFMFFFGRDSDLYIYIN